MIRMRIGILLAGALVVLALVTACSSGKSPPKAAADNVAVPGFGATSKSWAAKHVVMTSNFPPGCTKLCENRFYDKQSGGTARYEVTSRSMDRIIYLTVRPVPQLSHQAAMAEIAGLMPSDATIVGDQASNDCELVLMKSSNLGQTMRDAGLKDSAHINLDYVLFLIYSSLDTDTVNGPYKADAVREINMLTTAADGLTMGCGV